MHYGNIGNLWAMAQTKIFSGPKTDVYLNVHCTLII